MSRTNIKSSHEQRLETITLTTRSGLQVVVPINRWAYRDEITDVDLNFSSLGTLINERMLTSLRSVMTWYVERYAPKTLNNLMDRLRALFMALHVPAGALREKLSANDLLNYRALIGKSREYYFATLRSFLLKWSSLGYDGITPEAAEYLRDLRVDNNPRGTAVATLDPTQGPFTTIEHEGLLGELHDAYADRKLMPDAYHLVLLYTYFGARTIQFAALKTKDLLRAESKDGIVTYKLLIPRAKQGHPSVRSEFTERKLSRVSGDPLWEYRTLVEDQSSKKGLQTGESPLFPDWSTLPTNSDEFNYHHSPASLKALLNKSLKAITVQSERTGAKLHVTPVRFRRTIATNAAIEGKDVRTIAEILDHTDTQTANVYVGITPEIVERIDRAIALDLAPLAQAFKGTLIKSEDQASRGSDPSSRIIDLRVDRSGAPIGSCGQHSFCGFNAPIACYTCRNFEPWLDGPHDRVLDTLLSRREQLLQLRDPKILEVNDRTILAVAEVVRLCSAKQSDTVAQ